ncbi:MAG: ATP-dependent Clp protease ATP-binding subunit [bacterium]
MLQKYFRQSTKKVVEAINIGSIEFANLRQTFFTSEFVLLGLLLQENSTPLKIINEIRTNPSEYIDKIIERIYARQPQIESKEAVKITIAPEVEKLFEIASFEAKKFGDTYISTGTLFLALFNDEIKSCSTILKEVGLNYGECREVLERLMSGKQMENKDSETTVDILSAYTIDLNEKAHNNELDPVIGREDEIERMIEILCRRNKNNPIILGGAGVGKTALVEGLAQRISEYDVTRKLFHKRIFMLDMASVTAGAKFKGEFEERLKDILQRIIDSKGAIILFIDEIHTITEAGRGTGGLNAADIFKPALARGEIQIIGATTLDDYKKTIERDKALSRRFQPLILDETSIEDTIKILHGIKHNYEEHHEIHYTDDAIIAAAKLSERYITDRFLPDKAVDLIDEAGARKHLSLISVPTQIKKLEKEKLDLKETQAHLYSKGDFENVSKIQQEISIISQELEKEKRLWQERTKKLDARITENDIAHIISRATKIPVHRLIESEAEKLSTMEEKIHQRLISQDEAIVSVSNAIRRNRAGLKRSDKPIGSFIFLGPTGVGKTELAKALAEFLFDTESKIIRLDMSEYMEKHTVSKLVGSPPGYVGFEEGGQLTERIKRNPYSIVLLDELEKAHIDVFNMLLQILDDGRLTDSHGITVSFKNTIIIGTSNIGTGILFDKSNRIGFGDKNGKKIHYEELKKQILKEVYKFFKPEFINRIDDIIVFHPLRIEDILAIEDLHLQKLIHTVQENGYSLSITDAVKKKIAEAGYSDEYGARPLIRVIESKIENPLSLKIIKAEFSKGDSIIVKLVNDEIMLEKNNQK